MSVMADENRETLVDFLSGWMDKDVAEDIASPMLERFAVLPFPEPETYHQFGGERVSYRTGCQSVELRQGNVIELLGPLGYWNVERGDDPRPLAAALVAAHHRAVTS